MSSSYFQTVSRWVSHFDPISLEKMDNVSLMDRIDMKFILPFDRLGHVIAELNRNYRILTIGDNKVFSYRTDYYDTPELAMFSDHHNGKLNRYKVRHREYLDSQRSFLEIKFRSNNGRVRKQRIDDRNADVQLFTGFIAEHTPYNPKRLCCTLINHFNRCTLVDNQLRERVTADFNLAFLDSNHGVSLNGLVIIEIKQDHINKRSGIYQALKRNSIRPSTVSKYCVGLSLLNEKPKANNFKQTILQINKLSHVEFTS
jgi:hypothetical protein